MLSLEQSVERAKEEDVRQACLLLLMAVREHMDFLIAKRPEIPASLFAALAVLDGQDLDEITTAGELRGNLVAEIAERALGISNRNEVESLIQWLKTL